MSPEKLHHAGEPAEGQQPFGGGLNQPGLHPPQESRCSEVDRLNAWFFRREIGREPTRHELRTMHPSTQRAREKQGKPIIKYALPHEAYIWDDEGRGYPEATRGVRYDEDDQGNLRSPLTLRVPIAMSQDEINTWLQERAQRFTTKEAFIGWLRGGASQDHLSSKR